MRRYLSDDWRKATEDSVQAVWNSNLLRFIKQGIEWPRYIKCDGAECPIDWEHWHFVNEDGTAAGTDWMSP